LITLGVSKSLCGDSIEIMENFEPNSVHSIVSDIPYGIGFMGAEWDKFTAKGYQDFCFEWGSKAIQILKPGGYSTIFSAPRRYHRMVCGLEDAGFLIKDMINWEYGTGWPKNLDISLAINKDLGGSIKQGNMIIDPDGQSHDKRKKIGKPLTDYCYSGGIIEEEDLYEKVPTNVEALKWYGWGTGLKPAHEPIVLAQKPPEGTYAENVLKWGVGALNINACRINYDKNKEVDSRIYNREKNITRGHHENATLKYAPDGNGFPMYKPQKGRWPSNLLLDSTSAEMLDYQSGISGGSNPKHNNEIQRKGFSENGPFNDLSCGFDVNKGKGLANFGDKGGASRFFYCAKGFKNERNAGCENLYWEIDEKFKKITKKQYDLLPPKKRAKGNPISALKPINLMRYLVRLVTPPNGVVLDPFAGSGTTGIACIIEEFNYILIEKRKCFAEVIIPRRLKWWEEPSHWEILKDHPLLSKIQIKIQKKQNISLDTWF